MGLSLRFGSFLWNLIPCRKASGDISSSCYLLVSVSSVAIITVIIFLWRKISSAKYLSFAKTLAAAGLIKNLVAGIRLSRPEDDRESFLSCPARVKITVLLDSSY